MMSSFMTTKLFFTGAGIVVSGGRNDSPVILAEGPRGQRSAEAGPGGSHQVAVVDRKGFVEHPTVIALDEPPDHFDSERVRWRGGQVEVCQRGHGPGAVMGSE